MADFDLLDGNTIRTDYHPGTTGTPTFVFFNPLSGGLDLWEAAIGPALRKQGYGTLGWNYRGQQGS